MSLTRQDVLSEIANAALFGSFGLFVGTGFSKALTNGLAPSFKELLSLVALDLELQVNLDDPANLGKSYPRVALEMAKSLVGEDIKSGNAQQSLQKGLVVLKTAVCNNCNLVADENLAVQYRQVFEAIPIQWVITTNYDFILEDVIPNSIYLLPNQLLNLRNDYVPIYHLHGHIRSPENIVVTESDYVGLFSPTEYRQLKLNLLLAESTTLMLGYNLGDVNVQTAMEWSKVFKREKRLMTEDYQALVIQALYVSENPAAEPYYGDGGEVIIETANIFELLTEVKEIIDARKLEHAESRELLNIWMDKDKFASVIADDKGARAEFIATLQSFPRSYDVQTLLKFLRAVLEPIWALAREDGGFPHYDRFLNVLLDIIENMPIEDTHPSLFAYLAERLDDVAYFISPRGMRLIGDSWAATATWEGRNAAIPAAMKTDLMNYAKSHKRHSLLNILL